VFGDKEAEQERVPEFGGRSDCMNMRLSQHMIREHEENRTTWYQLHDIKEGSDRRNKQG